MRAPGSKPGPREKRALLSVVPNAAKPDRAPSKRAQLQRAQPGLAPATPAFLRDSYAATAVAEILDRSLHAARRAVNPDGCVAVALVALFVAGFARAEAPQALLLRYKCNFCHAETEAMTGPPFVDVAAKYRGNPEAVVVVAAAVRKGIHGSGPWHMPPHPEVSKGDAETMVRYILSLGK